MDTLELRLEAAEDYRAVEELTREAFWDFYAPGCDEHYLAHILRGHPCFVPELDYVAARDGRVLGSIMYSWAKVVGDDGVEHPVLCFGPLAVHPAAQGQGVGGALVRHTLALAAQQGHRAVLIYGAPAYYSRFGFLPAEHFGIGTADNMYMPPLQAIELEKGALAGCAGRFVEDAVYAVDAAKAAAFDAGFPPRKRHSGLPSQEEMAQVLQQRRPR